MNRIKIPDDTDDRPSVVFGPSEWRTTESIASLLKNVPELRQHDRRIVEIDYQGCMRYIPSAKLRHYIGVACRLVDERGIAVHPTWRLVNQVMCLGVYPGLKQANID